MAPVPQSASPKQLPPVLDFLSVLWHLNHCLEVTSSHTLSTKGVTAQQRMLLRVVQHEGIVSAGALAALLHVHPGTLSATLRRMESRRLVARRRDDADARRVLISVTARGKQITADASGTVEEAVAKALNDTSVPHVRATKALLRRIAQSLPGKTE